LTASRTFGASRFAAAMTAARSSVLTSRFLISTFPFTIVGVTPPEFFVTFAHAMVDAIEEGSGLQWSYEAVPTDGFVQSLLMMDLSNSNLVFDAGYRFAAKLDRGSEQINIYSGSRDVARAIPVRSFYVDAMDCAVIGGIPVVAAAVLSTSNWIPKALFWSTE
jgi:hypothetical protein